MREIKKQVLALIKYAEEVKIEAEIAKEADFEGKEDYEIILNVWVDGEYHDFSIATFEDEAAATKKFKAVTKTVKGWV